MLDYFLSVKKNITKILQILQIHICVCPHNKYFQLNTFTMVVDHHSSDRLAVCVLTGRNCLHFPKQTNLIFFLWATKHLGFRGVIEHLKTLESCLVQHFYNKNPVRRMERGNAVRQRIQRTSEIWQGYFKYLNSTFAYNVRFFFIFLFILYNIRVA